MLYQLVIFISGLILDTGLFQSQQELFTRSRTRVGDESFSDAFMRYVQQAVHDP